MSEERVAVVREPELAGTPATSPGRGPGARGQRPLDVRARPRRRSSQAPTKPGLGLDDGVRIVDVDAVGADREASSGREAQDRDARRPCQRAASSAAGSATTRTPSSGSSAGTMALRVVERRRADDRASRPSISTLSRNGVRRCQPRISALPSNGDVQLPVTLPTISPSAQIGAPSVGAVAVHREARSSAGGRGASRSARAPPGR